MGLLDWLRGRKKKEEDKKSLRFNRPNRQISSYQPGSNGGIPMYFSDPINFQDPSPSSYDGAQQSTHHNFSGFDSGDFGGGGSSGSYDSSDSGYDGGSGDNFSSD